MPTPKPSILLLGTQMEVAGAQRVLLSLASYFHRQGYQVKTAFFYDKQGLATVWQNQQDFPVISLDGWKHGGFFLANAVRLVGALLRLFTLLRKAQVIITYTPHSNLLSLPVAWLAGTPLRLGTHHGYIENAPRMLGRLHGALTNSAACTRMVCVSNQVRELAMQEESARPEKLVVIDNGIESPAEISLSAKDRDALRQTLGLASDQKLLITVGRLMAQKGHTYLLEAIAQLNDPLAVFVFVGQGPLRAELEEQASRLSVSNQVRFLGVRNDVPALLSVADVFVQPSLWEGMSLALLEAMFAGLPIVATRITAATDVLEDGHTGLLVEPRDPISLTNGLRRILSDARLREQLGVAAKRTARQSYTVDVMGAAYANLISVLQNV